MTKYFLKVILRRITAFTSPAVSKVLQLGLVNKNSTVQLLNRCAQYRKILSG